MFCAASCVGRSATPHSVNTTCCRVITSEVSPSPYVAVGCPARGGKPCNEVPSPIAVEAKGPYSRCFPSWPVQYLDRPRSQRQDQRGGQGRSRSEWMLDSRVRQLNWARKPARSSKDKPQSRSSLRVAGIGPLTRPVRPACHGVAPHLGHKQPGSASRPSQA